MYIPVYGNGEFKDQEAIKCLSSLHDKYVIVPADKASNNIVFACKSYNFECIIKELGIKSNTSSNTTYKPTSFNKDEILANHRSFMTSLSIPPGKESRDLPYVYWIHKLHKTPCKERYIAGSSTCSSKELSVHQTKIMSAIKERQHNYGSKVVVLGYNSIYFSNKIQKGKICFFEEQMISMLEFLIDNIFVSFGGTLFQQVVCIPMGTNCAPHLDDLFVYSYESDLFKSLEKIRRFMRLEPLISHTGILLTFYLSIILDLQNFFH